MHSSIAHLSGISDNQEYIRLYRAVSLLEYSEWITTGKLKLITGEKWFTTSISYIKRVKGKSKGKHVFKDRVISNVITLDVPLLFFTGRLAKKNNPDLPNQFKSLPSYKSGDKDRIQVKSEKGIINLGFFSQVLLDELINISKVV